jgi:hypothetical protein
LFVVTIFSLKLEAAPASKASFLASLHLEKEKIFKFSPVFLTIDYLTPKKEKVNLISFF